MERDIDEPGIGAAEDDDLRLLRWGYEAFSRRDYAEMVTVFHPDIELREPPELPDASVLRGGQGFIEVATKLDEAFADMEFQVRDFLQVDDRILVSIRWVGRGVGSGVESAIKLWHLWWFKDGLAIRMHAYLDESQALEAIKTSE